MWCSFPIGTAQVEGFLITLALRSLQGPLHAFPYKDYQWGVWAILIRFFVRVFSITFGHRFRPHDDELRASLAPLFTPHTLPCVPFLGQKGTVSIPLHRHGFTPTLKPHLPPGGRFPPAVIFPFSSFFSFERHPFPVISFGRRFQHIENSTFLCFGIL